MPSPADTVRRALAFGRSNDDLQPQSFWDEARAALDRMEDQICTLLAEREFGPQPYACPEPSCPVVTVGSGYTACPRCGSELQEVASA